MIPPEHYKYIDIFSKDKVNKLLVVSNKIYSIKTNGEGPLYRLIYTLSIKELKVLQEYLESSLEKG
jgi:hypothetical protein